MTEKRCTCSAMQLWRRDCGATARGATLRPLRAPSQRPGSRNKGGRRTADRRTTSPSSPATRRRTWPSTRGNWRRRDGPRTRCPLTLALPRALPAMGLRRLSNSTAPGSTALSPECLGLAPELPWILYFGRGMSSCMGKPACLSLHTFLGGHTVFLPLRACGLACCFYGFYQ